MGTGRAQPKIPLKHLVQLAQMKELSRLARWLVAEKQRRQCAEGREEPALGSGIPDKDSEEEEGSEGEEDSEEEEGSEEEEDSEED